MATGLVNPYAVAGGNTRYRDAVLADNPLSLWMLDEPYGNDVATDQGTSPSDGTYLGDLSTVSTQRGSRTIFGLNAIGNVTTGVVGSYILSPLNATIQAAMNSSGGSHDLTFEFLLNLDALGYNNYPMYNYQPWYINFRNTNRLEGRFYSSAGGQNDYARPSSLTLMSPGTDYHCVLGINGTSTRRTYYWYVNGAMISSNVYTGAWAGMNVQANLKIGGISTSSTSVGLHGGMAGVAIYDYFLGGAKALAHYNALL